MSSQWVSSGHALVGMTISQGVLIVPVQVELYDDVLRQLSHDALATIHSHDLHGLVLDLSQVQVMDAYMCSQVVDILHMASLLGVRSLVCGMQLGVVVSVLGEEALWQDVETALNLDAALVLLRA